MTSVNEFVVVKITSDHLKVGNDAKELHQKEHVGGYSKFDSPNDAFIGGVGEAIIEEILIANNLKRPNDYKKNRDLDVKYDPWDFFIVTQNISLEIKTQNYNLGKIAEFWEVAVAAQQIDKNGDYYIFIFVDNNFTEAIIVGFIEKKRYKELARFIDTGQEFRPGFCATNPMYRLSIDKLYEFKDLIKRIRK
jgi:hypothetical protein